VSRTCRLCKKPFRGRSDKIFCSVHCKSSYHYQLKQATNVHAQDLDKIIHRNHSILLEILGKNKKQIKVKRVVLEKKKFRFKYHTHFHVNSRGKTFFYVYNLAWMEFSDDEILIIRT
jgi:hypothetical protein